MSNILIYINAGGIHGMGHFRRSYAIGKYLELQGNTVYFTGQINDFCSSILSRDFKITYINSVEINDIIIDATEVSNEFKDGLSKKEKVILISPIFNLYEIVTHICLRSPIKDIGNIINENVYIDPYFSFCSCTTFLKPSYKYKDKLNIGICISGSEQYVDVSRLIPKLSDLKEVSVIKLISPFANNTIDGYQKLVEEVNFRNNFWDFFSNIDVFITGDGITLFEAISRGLPSLSFCRDEQAKKNVHFANHLFLQIKQNDWYTDKFIDQILDWKLLNKIKKNIEKAEIRKRSDSLGKTLLKIIDGN